MHGSAQDLQSWLCAQGYPTEIERFYGVLGIEPWQAVCNTSNKQLHLTRRALLGALFTSEGLQVLGSW